MPVAAFTREAAEDHRREIAARFGERILSGDAVFLAGRGEAVPLPITVSAGAPKNIGGFNSWMLRQVMRDRGWTDPRFFTEQQIRDMGGSLRSGAPAVVLQYVVPVEPRGTVVPVPELRRVPVFNAADVAGAGSAPLVKRASLRALAAALLDADFELGADVGAALQDWVSVSRVELGQMDESAGALAIALADAMATASMTAQLDLGPQDIGRHARVVQELLAAAPDSLAKEPAAFFQAVRAAELTSTRLMELVHMAEKQIDKTERLRPEAAHTVSSGTQRTAAGAVGVDRKRVASPWVQEQFEDRQAVLAVPFKEKDRAYALGAVYYPPLAVWFVPPGADLAKFKEWDPREHNLGQVAAEREILEEFAKAMQDIGLEPPQSIEADGKWHNVRVTTKKGPNKSGAYVLDLAGGEFGTPKGAMNNKHSGQWLDWHFEGPLMTLEQKARLRAAVQQRTAQAEVDARKARETAAVHAAEIVSAGQSAERNPYVLRKGISAEGLLQVEGKLLLQYPEFFGESGKSAIRPDEVYLIVPMKDFDGRLRAVQAINWDGSVKSFMRGAQKQGTSLVLGAPSLKSLCDGSTRAEAVAFAEGVATGASWRRPTGLPTVVCFDAGNLEFVARAAAKQMPAHVLPVLAVDNDQFFVERALGLLACDLGVNPVARSGSVVEILSGAETTRLVSLGDAIADGEWRQAPGGRYRMTLDHEPDSTEVRALKLEVLRAGQDRANAFEFSNRGVEAGRVAKRAFGEGRAGGRHAVLVIPEFHDLSSRPTDWNDLAKLQGYGQVAYQAQKALGPELPKREVTPAVKTLQASRAICR